LKPKEEAGKAEESQNEEPTSSKDMSVTCAEMLFRCNFVAFVSSEQPECVQIWDDFRRKVVTTLNVGQKVKAVKLRRDRIVAVTQEHALVYTFTGEPQQLNIFETNHNPRGLCALSPSADCAVLAFPAPRGTPASPEAYGKAGAQGCVRLIDLNKSAGEEGDIHGVVIGAHEAKLNCMAVNTSGTQLATSSEKGTLIRIFNTENGQRLTELRRGTQPANVYCINFSADSRLLCVSSSHGTIHVFSASQDDDGGKNKQAPFAKNAHINGLLPKYFSSEWSFSRIEVPGGTPCICAFGESANSVVAVCGDGSYNKFVFDPTKGSSNREVYQMIFEMGKS